MIPTNGHNASLNDIRWDILSGANDLNRRMADMERIWSRSQVVSGANYPGIGHELVMNEGYGRARNGPPCRRPGPRRRRPAAGSRGERPDRSGQGRPSVRGQHDEYGEIYRRPQSHL